jgi:hypothetical protein
MHLSRGKQEGQRIAEGIDQGMVWCSIRLCCARSPGLRSLLFSAGATLMRPHDGAVELGILIVCVRSQHLEHCLAPFALPIGIIANGFVVGLSRRRFAITWSTLRRQPLFQGFDIYARSMP